MHPRCRVRLARRVAHGASPCRSWRTCPWHTAHVARLRKRDVEAMLALYDSDPIAAVTLAMQTVLEQPGTDFRTLVELASFDIERRARLMAGEVDALDALVRELNELRTFVSAAGSDGS